jgi:hypothetical protein
MTMLATLFVGSSRGPGSTSHSLGYYLIEKLKARRMTTNVVFIQQSLSSEDGTNRLLRAADLADILILAAPLFADSHHASVIRALELIHEDVKKRANGKKRKMIAISNCGFPEASQNNVSLAISRQFAHECGFEWAGGLALGGGEAIHGKDLDAGGLVKNVRKSLNLTAEALAEGGNVPDEAVKLMALPLVPTSLYLLAANPLVVWLNAKKSGCKTSIGSKPYRA